MTQTSQKMEIAFTVLSDHTAKESVCSQIHKRRKLHEISNLVFGKNDQK